MKPKPKKPRKITLDKNWNSFAESWEYCVLIGHDRWTITLNSKEIKKLIPWLTKQQAYAKYLKRKKCK